MILRNSTGQYSDSATCCFNKILLKSQSLEAEIVCAMTKVRVSPIHLYWHMAPAALVQEEIRGAKQGSGEQL